MNIRHIFSVSALALTATLMASCGGGGGSSSSSLSPTPPTPPPSGSTSVTISGSVTFDLVPLNTATNGLDYNAISARPARGVVVEALDNAGTVLLSDVTDASGNYSFTVDSNTQIRIRAKAQMLQTSGAQWNVNVIDNTSNNSLYAIQGGLSSSGTTNSTRNLNAASGWGGSAYTGTRSAAPFAILDPIYESIQKFVAVDSDIIFPEANFGWSPLNRAASGDVTLGEIGTSSYVGNGRVNILGDANSDTDEFDRHVVIHEWGHYFEDQLSRSDSTGGPHSLSNRLDARIAMGEGFGNALSAIITDDPFYRDSFGNQQAQGFSINVESNTYSPQGWFNEGSVQSIIYDLYDSTDDGADALSLGLGPLYTALTNPAYTDNSLFTSVFAFLEEMKTVSPASAAAIDTISAAQGINGSGYDGAGETNNGGIASALPLYKTVTVDGPTVEICSVDAAGSFNKLGNRAFLRFTLPANATVTLTMARVSGATSSDPDFTIYSNGAAIARAESSVDGTETLVRALTAGDYAIEAYDFFNLGRGTDPTRDTCYNFTITQ